MRLACLLCSFTITGCAAASGSTTGETGGSGASEESDATDGSSDATSESGTSGTTDTTTGDGDGDGDGDGGGGPLERPTLTWHRLIDGPGGMSIDEAHAAAVDDAGLLYAAGSWGDDLWVGSFETDGTDRWSMTFTGAGGPSRAYAMGVSGDELWLVGDDGTDPSARVMRVASSDGALIAEQTFTGATGWSRGNALAVVPGGGAYVGGWELTEPVQGGVGAWVRRLGPDLSETWVARFGGAMGWTAVHALAVTSDGGAVGVGQWRVSEPDDDAWAVRLDANGSEQWSTVIAGPAMRSDAFRSVTLGPDDTVYAGGYIDGQNLISGDPLVAGIDPAGQTQWMHDYAGSALTDQFDSANAAMLDPVGNPVFGGQVVMTDGEGAQNFWFHSQEPGGDVRWARIVDSMELNDMDAINAIAPHPDGGIYAVGSVRADETDGTEIWIGRLDD